jgi:lipopolysaccharide export LptBFGC system permease protein LptF
LGLELIGAVLVGAGVWHTAGFFMGTSETRGPRGTLASISWSGIFGAPPIALFMRELRDVVA